ncbi:His/Glu/Gln/Arg/opine family amino acid ABC transporter permease subunit [Symbiobacterium terraclitae]|uniref:His/Glu/Gln/Arg/opine family amino acid ABC transporter permease subunit n=1 Tax=Symbiobacterium terraclitae TaxID=557451 RepID=A0ABS4JU25_9FIRM|nr:amino acid ABC transporter permease [Symbiobacterium terraclitae]MBP2019064.1 His/Glu/Gln/Arg/opine family amino acid ABC transporter permease subunit [Symbiobacterium terraclitae]
MERFIAHTINILPVLLEGLGVTLSLTFISALVGTLLGLLAALARISRNPLFTLPASGYVTLFRGTPLLLQLLFIYNALPQMGLRLPAFQAAVVAFSLNAGAYIAEIIRAAIQSIDRGQMEAARSLGMSYGMAMRRVILPQTYRRLLPPMVNELAALTKDTSLASSISILELMKYSQQFVSRTALVAQTFVWTAVFYLVVTVGLSTLASHLEKKLEARG